MTDTLVVLRRSPVIDDLARCATAPQNEHNWEGTFTGSAGSADGFTVTIKANITFATDLIEGVGRAVNLSADAPAGAGELAISGTQHEDVVHFELWFGAAEMARESFSATGILSADGREMLGRWTVGCFDPQACGCSGGGGEFKLKRVD